MKKSVLLFAIIASIFVACNQHNDVDYVNQDLYGVWAATYNYPHTDVLDTLICHINEYNSEFISEDSLIIYHGKEKYTENSDLGYIKYKYEVVKNEKLILTYYNRLYDAYTTREFQWRPDLISVVDAMNNNVKYHEEINGFCGKYEWISTENLDSSKTKFTKHIIDTIENSIIEFKINDFILVHTTYPGGPYMDGQGCYVKYSQLPYTAIISKKDAGVIEDKVLPYIYRLVDYTTKEAYYSISFEFPRYNSNGEYSGSVNGFGGSSYKYKLEDNKLILEDQFSDCIITFKRLK